jgi:phosphoenolpyruvate synthase/pyruvate phosphate dikinase
MLRQSAGPLVVPLNDVRPSDEEISTATRVLARLARLAIVVPPGLVVRHAAWLNYLDSHAARERWQSFEAGPTAAQAATLRDVLEQAPLPPGLLATLHDALERGRVREQPAIMPPQAQRRYIVRPTLERPRRSSARVAPSPTYLPDAHHQQLDITLRQAWTSLFAPSPEARPLHSAAASHVSVLVQALPQLDCAGLVRTQTIQNEGMLEIGAVWGLAAPLVPQRNRPDRWLVARRSGELLRHIAGERTQAYWLGAGGIEQQALEAWAPPPLTEQALAQLRRIALQIEGVLGQPQQIAWLHDGIRFWVIDAHPLAEA